MLGFCKPAFAKVKEKSVILTIGASIIMNPEIKSGRLTKSQCRCAKVQASRVHSARCDQTQRKVRPNTPEPGKPPARITSKTTGKPPAKTTAKKTNPNTKIYHGKISLTLTHA